MKPSLEVLLYAARACQLRSGDYALAFALASRLQATAHVHTASCRCDFNVHADLICSRITLRHTSAPNHGKSTQSFILMQRLGYLKFRRFSFHTQLDIFPYILLPLHRLVYHMSSTVERLVLHKSRLGMWRHSLSPEAMFN